MKRQEASAPPTRSKGGGSRRRRRLHPRVRPPLEFRPRRCLSFFASQNIAIKGALSLAPSLSPSNTHRRYFEYIIILAAPSQSGSSSFFTSFFSFFFLPSFLSPPLFFFLFFEEMKASLPKRRESSHFGTPRPDSLALQVLIYVIERRLHISRGLETSVIATPASALVSLLHFWGVRACRECDVFFRRSGYGFASFAHRRYRLRSRSSTSFSH